MKKISILIPLILFCQITLAQRPTGRTTRPSEPQQTSTQEKQRPTRDASGNSWNDVEILFSRPYIFTKAEMQVGGDNADKKAAYIEAIKKSNAVIEEYKSAVDQFMQGNPSPYIYTNKLKTSEARSKGVVNVIKQTENEFKGGNSLGGVYYLQQIYIFKGYMEAQTKVFPESQIIKDHLQMANDAIQKYGTTDKYLGKMEENKKEYAKNLKLIPAGQKNPKIEALAKKDYEAFAKNFTVTKVNITDGAWRIEKNDLGIPLNRKVSVSIAVKNNKGECGIAGANIIEEYSGGGNYGSSVMYLPTDAIIVPCENIK